MFFNATLRAAQVDERIVGRVSAGVAFRVCHARNVPESFFRQTFSTKAAAYSLGAK
jgi:hypothetical protein